MGDKSIEQQIDPYENPLMHKLAGQLNLGCGPGPLPKGWIHLDGSWNARLSKHIFVRRLLRACRVIPADVTGLKWDPDIVIHDVRRPLALESDSLAAVYASHLLEHVYLEEAQRLLKECFRVLGPGGVLRLVVPDLRAAVLEYLGQYSFGDLTDEMTAMGPPDRLNRRLGFRGLKVPRHTLHRWYTAFTDFHSHKWIYDAASLRSLVVAAGFVQVEEMTLHQSTIPGIAEVEKPERVLTGGICIEGIRGEE